MRVVILTGGPGISGAAADALSDELGIRDESDIVTVVNRLGIPTPLGTAGGTAGGTVDAGAQDSPRAKTPDAPSSALLRLRRQPKVVTVARSGAASLRLVAQTSRSRHVQTLVAQADVVVALDSQSHRAAWLLARRHPGPDVVSGATAGKRVIAARRLTS